MLFCRARPWWARYFKRELCQSVCSSAICLIRRRRQSCESTCRASAYPHLSSFPSIARPAVRAASRSSTTRIAPSPKRRSSEFDQQPFKGRGLAVSEARPREERGRRAPPRPGGFSSPRPGGFVGDRARPAGPAATARRRGRAASAARGRRTAAAHGPRGTKNFGPDAPPKHKRKPHGNRARQAQRPDQGASGQPVSTRRRGLARRRNEDPLDIDNIATHKDVDDAGRRRRRRGAVDEATDDESTRRLP